MRQRIIRDTITELGEDTKFIRLATVTMFIHSLILTILIIWYSHYFIDNAIIGEFIGLFKEFIAIDGGWFIPVLIIIIILAIGYWILPPIGEAALLIYKHEGRQQGTASLSKGLGKFFPMFEFHAATGLFHINVVLFAVLRMYILDIINNGLIVTLIIIWIFLTIFASIFFAYSKMYIVLEGESFFDAMKRSASLALRHIGITVQFALLTFLLLIRFVINIIVLVGIPLGIIYLGTWMGLDNIWLFKTLFVLLMLFLILLVSYIEGIIEAFFITCRRKVWHMIRHDDSEKIEEPAVAPIPPAQPTAPVTGTDMIQ